MPKAVPKGKTKRNPAAPGPTQKDRRLFTLQVYIVGGPVTEKFAKQNPVMMRAIQIRGDQTLFKLHCAIFDAFGRDDEHMYEFQIGGERPMDRNARRYVLPVDYQESIRGPNPPAGDVTRTPIGSLGLKVNDVFLYWFDFGDDWWHQITVASITSDIPPGKYPKLIERIGADPPQYMDWDEEEEDE